MGVYVNKKNVWHTDATVEQPFYGAANDNDHVFPVCIGLPWLIKHGSHCLSLPSGKTPYSRTEHLPNKRRVSLHNYENMDTNMKIKGKIKGFQIAAQH